MEMAIRPVIEPTRQTHSMKHPAPTLPIGRTNRIDRLSILELVFQNVNLIQLHSDSHTSTHPHYYELPNVSLIILPA